MLLEIVRHTPSWVWVLLAALVAFGLSQMRARRVARAQILMLPGAMLALGVSGLWSTFSAMPPSLPTWLAALALGTLAGLRLPVPAGTRVDAGGTHLHLPGSLWPLATILVIFAFRYAVNVELALHAAWRLQPGVMLPVAALYGVIGGLLLGRAGALLRTTGTGRLTIAGT